MFTWVPIYTELAIKLLPFRNRQSELITVLADLKRDGTKSIFLDDYPGNGTKAPLAEIDPFTFFASFNRHIKDEHRIAHLVACKRTFGLAAVVPDDFHGIPLVDNTQSWFFGFKKDRQPDDITSLWELAAKSVNGDVNAIGDVLFNRCLDIYCVAIAKLTIGLFWLNSEHFLPADNKTKSYGKSKGVDVEPTDFESYRQWLAQMTEVFGNNYPQISHDAHLSLETNAADAQPLALKDAAPRKSKHRYWLYSPGEQARFWQECQDKGVILIGYDDLGDFHQYKSQEAIEKTLKKEWGMEERPFNHSRAVWEFAKVIQPGDVVIVKKGRTEYLGYGIVTGPCERDDSRSEYKSFRKVIWKKAGTWSADFDLVVKALTDITKYPDYVAKLKHLIGIETDGVIEPESHTPVVEIAPFTKADALAGLFMPEPQLNLTLARLKQKKALILQGPPGVGKTFVAKRLAYAMMGRKDDRRVCMVQFHPSYGYEDFIQGYRPSLGGGLERRDGVFYEFARLARNDPEHDWFFIIDEINRGNLAKIFGELLMLLEADKRGPDHVVSLTYSEKGEQFYLPKNLHVIGTMNTADRSLAMVDYALRRRFAFVTLEPAVNSNAFSDWLIKHGATKSLLDQIRAAVGLLNAAIEKERDLGERFRIGHSFFCPAPGQKPDAQWYREIIQTEIKPLLEEYFDSKDRIENLIAEVLK